MLNIIKWASTPQALQETFRNMCLRKIMKWREKTTVLLSGAKFSSKNLEYCKKLEMNVSLSLSQVQHQCLSNVGENTFLFWFVCEIEYHWLDKLI